MYSHPSGSENSFVSIISVSDLGFSRQEDPNDSETLEPETDQHPDENEVVHPPERGRSNNPGWNGDSPDFSDSIRSHESINSGSKSASLILEDRLRSSYADSISNLEGFLPCNKLRQILTSYNIREVLKEIIPRLAQAGCEEELSRLDQDICGTYHNSSSVDGPSQQNSRLRLFAVLLCIGKAQCIQCFVKCGVDDSYLPISYYRPPSPRPPSPRPAGPKFTLHARQDTSLKDPLKCFEEWLERDVWGFLREQYAMLAPFFDLDNENVCLYHLPPKTIMPFVEFEEAIGEGGQASVSKAQIHPAHHNFKSKQPKVGSSNPSSVHYLLLGALLPKVSVTNQTLNP